MNRNPFFNQLQKVILAKQRSIKRFRRQPYFRVGVIGGGLAGVEASYFLANLGFQVILAESKEIQKTPAQKTEGLAELVCTNSLKSIDPFSAHGLLKEEMQALGSLILEVAKNSQVPAGKALAVDRVEFSQSISHIIKNHSMIEFHSEVIDDPLQWMHAHQLDSVIVATGPLTLAPLEQWIAKHLGREDWYFYDAISPIIDGETIDFSQPEKVFYGSRYQDKMLTNDSPQDGDYLNLCLNREEYYAFVQALREGEKVPPKNFEEEIFFEACLPIDVMAERGLETPRFSCMKPVGLTPQFKNDKKQNEDDDIYAIAQLRRENLLGHAYNLVGMQTRLTFKEQKRIFSMLPGLKNAEFLQFGSVHRNSFIHAAKCLKPDMSSPHHPFLFFAGQITGVEGYTESAASGLSVALTCALKLLTHLSPVGLNSLKAQLETAFFPVSTAIGALRHFILSTPKAVPSSIHFALFPEVDFSRELKRKLGLKTAFEIRQYKRQEVTKRARLAFEKWQRQILFSLSPLDELQIVIMVDHLTEEATWSIALRELLQTIPHAYLASVLIDEEYASQYYPAQKMITTSLSNHWMKWKRRQNGMSTLKQKNLIKTFAKWRQKSFFPDGDFDRYIVFDDSQNWKDFEKTFSQKNLTSKQLVFIEPYKASIINQLPRLTLPNIKELSLPLNFSEFYKRPYSQGQPKILWVLVITDQQMSSDLMDQEYLLIHQSLHQRNLVPDYLRLENASHLLEACSGDLIPAIHNSMGVLLTFKNKTSIPFSNVKNKQDYKYLISKYLQFLHKVQKMENWIWFDESQIDRDFLIKNFSLYRYGLISLQDKIQDFQFLSLNVFSQDQDLFRKKEWEKFLQKCEEKSYVNFFYNLWDDQQNSKQNKTQDPKNQSL